MAFPADYTLLAKLSTVPAQVSATESGFTVLITETSLGAQATNIFANTDNGGGDVRLSLDAAGLNQLPVDIPTGGWDTVGGTCQLWTKIDIDSATAVDVYVWGDNAGDTQPSTSTIYGRNSAHSSKLRAWHMEEDPSGTAPQMVDSTGNASGLTAAGGLTSGDSVTAEIEKGIRFDDVAGYLEETNRPTLGTAYSITTVFKPVLDEQNPIIAFRSTTTTTPIPFQILQTTGDIRFAIRDNAGNLINAVYSSSLSTSNYNFITAVRNGNNTELFLNGVSVATGSGTLGTITAYSLLLGALNSGGSVSTPANGVIDESNICGWY